MSKISRFNLALVDSVLLGVLIVAMCSQINIGDIGQDTTAQGYVTKQLKIALPDIALILNFLWFAIRTSLLRAWKKLWWPPFPCWALIFALVLATLHSRPLVTAVTENLAEAEGASEIIKGLITKESKEAVADTIQFTLYFVIAPLLFVNLIHDRRGAVLTTRRRLVLTTFLWAVVASLVLAFIKKGDFGFQGLFGSPYAVSAFLAIALSLLGASIFRSQSTLPKISWLLAGAVIVALALLSSLWSVLALLLGLLTAYLLLTPHRTQSTILLSASIVAAVVLWWLAPAPPVTVRTEAPQPAVRVEPPLRVQSAQISSSRERVKKQFVEWYVGATRLADSREAGFATGAGPGNYQFNIGAFYSRLPNEEKMPPDSNNLYLVQAVNLGVLGLGALLWIVLHFGNVAVEARRRFPNDWLAAGVLGALTAWVFVNLFHATIVRGTGVVFAFILSLAVVAAHYGEYSDREAEVEDSLSDEEKRNFLHGSLS